MKFMVYTILVIGGFLAVICTVPKNFKGPNKGGPEVESMPKDRIPICPSCQHGTVREVLRKYDLWIEAPLIYDSTGRIMSRNASVEIDVYKCYICGTIYSWYDSGLYGEGYYIEGMKFTVNRLEKEINLRKNTF